MAKAWISEYSQVGMSGKLDGSLPPGVGANAPLALEPSTDQVVTFTTTTQSAAFAATTRFVRFMVDTDGFVVFGANPTATADKQKVVAYAEYWRAVVPTHKAAFVAG